jgi:hypothetical protein
MSRFAGFQVRERRLRQRAVFLLFQQLFKLFALHGHVRSSFYFTFRSLYLRCFSSCSLPCLQPLASDF